MENWKTTASGVIAAVPQMLPMLGVTIIPVPVLQAISVIGLFLIGLFAKDGK